MRTIVVEVAVAADRFCLAVDARASRRRFGKPMVSARLSCRCGVPPTGRAACPATTPQRAGPVAFPDDLSALNLATARPLGDERDQHSVLRSVSRLLISARCITKRSHIAPRWHTREAAGPAPFVIGQMRRLCARPRSHVDAANAPAHAMHFPGTRANPVLECAPWSSKLYRLAVAGSGRSAMRCMEVRPTTYNKRS